jgi:regulator of PEP synthase PpsR (kinase-PPPase family)
VAFCILGPKEARTAIQPADGKHTHPMVGGLARMSKSLNERPQVAPHVAPGILYEIVQPAFDRIDAARYTLARDDGCSVRELHLANVVLLGGSRTRERKSC